MDSHNAAEVINVKGIKIVHINVRSIYNKMDQFRTTFHGMDVIIVSETWLTPAIPDASITLPGYRLIRLDRTSHGRGRGGGLCIYVKSKFSVKSLDNEFNIISDDYELIGVQVKHPFIKPFNIIGLYRPPNGQRKAFFRYLTDNVNLPLLIGDRCETYILGDFNVDYATDKTLKQYRLENIESKFNLRQLITTYTRSTQLTDTIIDWIYTDSQHIVKSGTLDNNVSDHLPIYLVRKKTRNKIVKHNATGRSYLRYDKELFGQILNQQDWTVFDDLTDVTKMWDILETNISASLNEICPIRNLRVSESKPHWLNNELIQLMRKRDVAYRKARRTKIKTDWIKATFLRNRVETFIKKFKKRKITDSLNRNRNNPAKFWRDIRSVMPKDETIEVTSLTDETTGQTYTSEGLADYINTYFTNIGCDLANAIASRRNDVTGLGIHTVANVYVDGITGVEISEVEFRNAMKSIDINKSSAVPNIRASVILDTYDIIFERILRLYNVSLNSLIFPNAWKISIVVPLPKVNNPETASDMRPISLIPLPGKIMEHLVSRRLKNFIHNNEILSKNQHGFRKSHSTITSITTLLHNIYLNVNSLKDTYLVYLDLKKAFDTVSHKILLNKLTNFGLGGLQVIWQIENNM